MDGRTGVDHGPAPPGAAARGRAVPPRVHPDHRRQGPPAELPRPRGEGEHQAPPRARLARRRDARPRTRRAQAMGTIMDGEATPAQIGGAPRGAWPRGARPRTRWWASPGRCARGRRAAARSKGAVDTCGTGGDGAGTFNISTRRLVRGRRPAASRSPSTATARPAGAAAAPTCSRRLGVRIDAPAATRAEGPRRGRLDLPLRAAVPPGDAARRRPARRSWACARSSTSLGPLTNPARPEAPARRRAAGRARALRRAVPARGWGRSGAWVVNGSGLDELTLAGPTAVAALDGEDVRTFTVTPGGRRARLRPARGACGGATRRRTPRSPARCSRGDPGPQARRRPPERGRGARGRRPRARTSREGARQAAAAIDDGRARRARSTAVAGGPA